MAGVYWAVKEKPKAGRRLSSAPQQRNRRYGAILPKLLPPRRRRQKHVFRVSKCQLGHRKSL